jgi:hypothetical protein
MSFERWGRRVWWNRLRLIGAASLVVTASSCGLFDAPPPLPTPGPSFSNLIANPGFEILGAPWIAIGFPPPPVTTPPLSTDRPHGGNVSLDLSLLGREGSPARAASAGWQRLGSATFPEFVSGFYRVDDWQPHADFQYLYFGVTVRGGDFVDGMPLHEIRFLVGAPENPAPDANVAYIFLSRAAPVLHQWTYFSYPVRQAFDERFGGAPNKWDSIEVQVGVRFDGRKPEDPPSSAEVFFDDMYAGPQADNSNRPPEP